MIDIKVDEGLSDDLIIWRYSSLDKLIYLLSTNVLYFPTTKELAKNDPFEGYAPDSLYVAIKKVYEQVLKESEKVNIDVTNIAKTQEAKIKIRDEFKNIKDSSKIDFEIVLKHLAEGICISCWHQNNYESEAFWKLYSDGGKGIAIKTNLGKLVSSIQKNLIKDDITIIFGLVKYLDFNDKYLTAGDCTNNGHTIPMIKRIAYKHENEFRGFITPNLLKMDINKFKAIPAKIPVDINILIDKIYISPYADEPFRFSVKEVCNKYGLKLENIIESNLLKNQNENLLLDNF